MYWNFGDDLKSEQENTLILLDKQFENRQVRPSFEILGGTALLLHDIEHVVTVDIDVANKLDEEVRSIVEPLILRSPPAREIVPKSIPESKFLGLEVKISCATFCNK